MSTSFYTLLVMPMQTPIKQKLTVKISYHIKSTTSNTKDFNVLL